MLAVIYDAGIFYKCTFLMIQNLKIRQRGAYSLLWRKTNFKFAFPCSYHNIVSGNMRKSKYEYHKTKFSNMKH